MSNPFKAGDTVECINDMHCDGNQIQKGLSYLVKKVEGPFLQLHHTHNYAWHCDRFVKCTVDKSSVKFSDYLDKVTSCKVS